MFGPGEGETGVLAISDDGCGYDPDAVTRSRLGLWLVDGLSSQVQGRLTVACGPGVKARLVFVATPEQRRLDACTPLRYWTAADALMARSGCDQR